jgi:hypothetical protein
VKNSFSQRDISLLASHIIPEYSWLFPEEEKPNTLEAGAYRG